MVKLIDIVHNSYVAPTELWALENDIEATVTRKEKTARVTISNTTGDITDQIYSKLKVIDYFEDLELGGVSCYSMTVPLEKFDKLLQHIETMDKKYLKEGKRY